MKIKTLKLLCAASIGLILSACGGGSGSTLDNTIGKINGASSSSATNASNSNSSAVDTTSPQKIGYIQQNGTFSENVIGSNKPAGDLSAGGTVVLTINVVSSTNTLVTTPVEITFNSPCVATGEAILKVGTTATNKVTATNGSASIAYTANGCTGNDDITASASINSQVVNARLTMPVASDQVQSIKFVDTTPNQISLAGTGGTETSVVRFQILGNTGAPMKDVAVSFELSTTVGGMNLTNSSLKTDSSGYASTTVQAGNIHTSVRVTATATVSGIFTTSNQLIVSTGIPDQDSMSLAATATHPIGWNIDGVESTLTIRLSDAFNNPPPLNTNVAFRTEGGSIIDGCLTSADGSCSVKWTSRNPRPSRNHNDTGLTATQLQERKLCVDSSGNALANYAACRLERAGRVTVLATAIGNESFIDTNGNGVFDAGDIFRTAADGGDCRPNVPILSGETPPNSADKPCDDLSEAYLDKDESGIHESNEEFVDFTSIGAEGTPDNLYTAGNGKYNGVLCLTPSSTCTRSQVTIRRDITLVMTSKDLLWRQGTLPFLQKQLPYVAGNDLSYGTWFWLADENGNGIGAGTTLTTDSTNLQGGTGTISSKGPLVASDDPTPIGTGVTITDVNTPPSGNYNINIKTPTILGDITTPETVYVDPAILVVRALANPTLGSTGTLIINGATVSLLATDDVASVVAKINARMVQTSIPVTASVGLNDMLLLLSYRPTMVIAGDAAILAALNLSAATFNPSILAQ